MTTIHRWSRQGILTFQDRGFAFKKKLIFSEDLKSTLLRKITLFLQSEQYLHDHELAWRHGLFLYGPRGSGKTSAAMLIARQLEWDYFEIPHHEILDAHLFEKALKDVLEKPHRVIVFEQIDQIIQKIDAPLFYEIFDHSIRSADGFFLIATTYRPEETSKAQLIRPGRFDESVAFDLPRDPLRQNLLQQSLKAFLDPSQLSSLYELEAQLSYAHFEELKMSIIKNAFAGKSKAELEELALTYLDDQIIEQDRFGKTSVDRAQLNEQIKALDPRMLLAACEISSAFRKLIEQSLSDAFEKAQQNQNGS